MNLALLQQLDLQKEILQYGKDSFEVSNLRVEQSIDAYNQQVEKLVEANELTSEQGDILKTVNAGLQRSAQTATAFRDILSEVSSVMGGIAIQSYQLMSLQNLQGSMTYSGRGGDPRSFTGDYTNELGYKTVEDLIKELTKSSGGGKSEAEKAAERLANLEKQIALEKELVGASEARSRILKALGLEFASQNPEIVAGLEDQLELLQKMQQEEAGLKSFAQTLQSSLGDAFMSIVDGSKSAADAFKDMIRIVIKKALELSVINPILNMLFGGMGMPLLPTAFGSARGNVFSGGHVTAFADGGVVGGPTYFPMTGGKTGLMGEAGPEAIMPMKRGKDGKLGVQTTGGAVTVNQTINISTGVQQTVRTEIKSLMPMIADNAKSAVLDAKRRGEAGF